MQSLQDSGQCGICRSALSGAKLTACGACRALYHPDCWEWSGKRCATYGCGTSEQGKDAGYSSSIELLELRKRADTFIDQGSNEQAIGLLTAILERHPNDAAALALRGLALWRIGQNEKAEGDFRATLSARPQHPETLYNLSCLMLEEGRSTEAHWLLNRCMACAPSNWPNLPIVADKLARMHFWSSTRKILAIVALVVIVGVALISC